MAKPKPELSALEAARQLEPLLEGVFFWGPESVQATDELDTDVTELVRALTRSVLAHRRRVG